MTAVKSWTSGAQPEGPSLPEMSLGRERAADAVKSGVRSLDLIQAMVTLGCLELNWAMVAFTGCPSFPDQAVTGFGNDGPSSAMGFTVVATVLDL